MSDINYELKQHLGVLSSVGNYQKQVNVICWNDGKSQLDIRTWNVKNENEPKPLKGIALNYEETKELLKIIDGFEMPE